MRIFPVGRFPIYLTGPELEVCRPWVERIETGLQIIGDAVPWFPEIPELYRKRKADPGRSWAIKIVLNSLYGKLAQTNERWKRADLIGWKSRRIGRQWYHRSEAPADTACYFAAAYITAGTRLKIWEAISRQPDAVVMISTDGIVLTEPLDGSLGPVLGEWSEKLAGGRAVVIGTGVYGLEYPDGWRDQTRGFRWSKPLVEILDTDRRIIPVPTRRVHTLGDWVTRKDPLNAFVTDWKSLDVNFDRKRVWPRPFKNGREVLTVRQNSKPWIVV